MKYSKGSPDCAEGWVAIVPGHELNFTILLIFLVSPTNQDIINEMRIDGSFVIKFQTDLARTIKLNVCRNERFRSTVFIL